MITFNQLIFALLTLRKAEANWINSCDGAPNGVAMYAGLHCLFALDKTIVENITNQISQTEYYMDRDLARSHCRGKYDAWLPVLGAKEVVEKIRQIIPEKTGYVPMGIRHVHNVGDSVNVTWDTGLSGIIKQRGISVPWWLDTRNGEAPFLWLENGSFVSPSRADTANGPIRVVCHKIYKLSASRAAPSEPTVAPPSQVPSTTLTSAATLPSLPHWVAVIGTVAHYMPVLP